MNTECLFSLFGTSIGPCGIVWTRHGATAASPSPEIQSAIDRIAALLRGEASDLGGIALDMRRVPAFDRRVYQAARGIAPGMTLTYGELAAQLGDSGLARAVGQALARNPMAIVVPCHRVLAAGGKYGGFSANGGVTTKLKLLAIEGARRSGAPDLFSIRT
jgi:methylated-DNA-[protein]-cysteine S-methyltransferase